MIMCLQIEPKVLRTVAGEYWVVHLVDLAQGLFLLDLVLFVGTLVPDKQVLVERVALTVGEVLEQVLLLEDLLCFS